MKFVCNLGMARGCPPPRPAELTDLPVVWIRDCGVAYEKRALLGLLLGCLAPGQVVDADELSAVRHELDPPVADLVPELVAAGYLRRVAADGTACCYELVHPDRLPPLTGEDAQMRLALPYGERKPYVVADNLDDLKGPTSGVITLPRHIDWSGSPTRDLDARRELFTLYPTVLAEASSVADLNAWLDKATLVRGWPNLSLPAKIRRLWEARFPELAATRMASR